MRTTLVTLLLSLPAFANEGDTFHGWSKDGTYLAFQATSSNDLVELYFCPTDATVPPSWPADLNEADRVDENGLSCVRFIDANKAPYQWKNALSAAAPAAQFNGITAQSELVTDGESPGLVLEIGPKKQTCYLSGLREDSKLQKTWWHPSGRWLGVLVDGRFHHCAVTLKGAKALPVFKPAPPPKPGKKK